MSAASQIVESGEGLETRAKAPLLGEASADVREILSLLERLAAFYRAGQLGDAVEAPLDAMLTAKQAGRWLQLSEKTLNAAAKAGEIPAFRAGGTNEWRFHPRTILEAGHRWYRKVNKIL